MKKTKKMVTLKMDVYSDGRKAAQENRPRFAPFRLPEAIRTWFAGYDSAKEKK
jgi:hypothetical protein